MPFSPGACQVYAFLAFLTGAHFPKVFPLIHYAQSNQSKFCKQKFYHVIPSLKPSNGFSFHLTFLMSQIFSLTMISRDLVAAHHTSFILCYLLSLKPPYPISTPVLPFYRTIITPNFY